MQFPVPDPLVVLVGPTAVGKTQISIELALRLNGEIISADSRLFYQGMDIGTAKPSRTKRELVPHYMIDIAKPDEIWNVSQFQKQAYLYIDEILAKNRFPILVGGTGQFIKAVVEGWTIPRQKPNPNLRVILENWAHEIGEDNLYKKLIVLDPLAAVNIEPRNVRRTIRAIEVIFETGYLFSSQRNKKTPRYNIKILGINRPRIDLYSRIDQRIDNMLNNGFEDEVRRLLLQGYSPQLPSLSAIGYHEIINFIIGKTTLEEAVTLIKRRSRLLVRRQANWFKPTDPSIHWFEVSSQVVDQMTEYIISGEGWKKNEKINSFATK
jgi:tRNA dimethylallyltransferase